MSTFKPETIKVGNTEISLKKEKIPEVINELITNEVVSGSIIRIDGDINE